MLLLNYNMNEKPQCDTKIKDCCVKVKQPPETNSNGDCCYDEWVNELKNFELKFNKADNSVNYISKRRVHLGTQRDMWKAWMDELDKVCEYSKNICQQLEIVLHHTSRISRNEWLTKRAVNLLFCMIRDFYMQIDVLKKKYDRLINCIKCLNSQNLVAGQGVMALIEDYGKKITLVMQTRETLPEAVITSISMVNNINKSLGHHGHQFGLTTVLNEWKKAFNCEGKKQDEGDNKKRNEFGREDFNNPGAQKQEFENTGLEPALKFPVCESDYYKMIERKYLEDSRKYSELSKLLNEETKKRDNLKGLRDGLASVISDPNVDPSKRCATNVTK